MLHFCCIEIFAIMISMKYLIEELSTLGIDKNILIVEDDEAILSQLSSLYRRFFQNVFEATSIKEALKQYHSNAKPLLVVSDISLPDGSGLKFVGEIKKADKNQKILIISALNEAQIFIESINQGVDKFVTKPVRLEELLSSTIEVLKKLEYDLALIKSNKELQDSRDYALKLLQDQDIFLQNALHEINTPLSIIITNVGLLRLNGIKSDSLEHIQAATRMIQVSYDDIAYNMMQDRLCDIKEKIELNSFVKERLEYFSCIAEANELKFALNIEGDSEIYFSKIKLMRLVDNTISNAIKYAKKPSQISIYIQQDSAKVMFGVKNYGIVINDKVKIFERFYREATQKGGYGLGLSMVKQICDENGVKIELSSSKDKGTFFRYFFA